MSAVWREARTDDGRIYYYNNQTRQTQWQKPPELQDRPVQQPIAPATPPQNASAWREATQPETGRSYYYNTETKETTWEIPEALRQARAQSQVPPTRPQATAFVAGGGAPNFQPAQNRDERRPMDRPDRFDRDRNQQYQADGYRPVAAGTTDKPQFATQEEAQSAFLKLLKRVGVQPEWSWQQAMKATINDPQYRALEDPKERKAAFEKFVIETREQDKERAKERVAKLREDFTKMLQSHPEIKHYTRWKTARPIIEGETIFRSTSDDTERRQLYEEYITRLQKTHAESESAKRKSALDDLTNLLPSLNLEPYTRWSDAHGLIEEHDTFKSDDKFQSLTTSDILNAFQDHVKALERDFNDKRQREKNTTMTEERQNRDQFIELVRELRSNGKIRAGTKWKDIRPLVENDTRYSGMLGQGGSTPLDLLWDAVEDEEREYRAKRNEVLDVLDDQRFELTSQTKLEDFASVMKKDPRTTTLAEADVTLVYHRLHEKVLRREEKDKYEAERQIRNAIKSLQSRIKRLNPPIAIDDDWETVRGRIERYDEYHALETDEQRKTAFDKVIQRMREKEDDEAYARERAIRRAERERDDRHSHHSRRASYYARSPAEPDAYEAERKKAQAARERNYHKSSGTGLSPRHRDDHYDRRHRHERDRERERAGYHDFDREYRERERTYRSRLSDPSGELDYGDGGRAGSSISTSGGRRRRESDVDGESSRRESKRHKSTSKTNGTLGDDDVEMREKEDADKRAQEDENLKSGSEEGEIEEV